MLSFHSRPTTTHHNLLHSPLFFNPWILKNPQVKDFTSCNTNKKTSLNPEDYGIINIDIRLLKVLELLAVNRFKTLETLKDDIMFWKSKLPQLPQTQTTATLI